MTRILTAIVCTIIFCSCRQVTGSGNIITQARHVNQFNGVNLSGSIDVEVMNDASQSIKIEADDNIMPYIITSVENGMLEVYLKHHFSYQNIHAKVYVSAPALQRLFVSGSGSITSAGTLKETEQVETRVTGSGDIKASVDAPSVTADVIGSGTITLQGRTKNFDCSIGGSGDIKCGELLSENTTASITGSGTAHVYASVHLIGKIIGSGDILYRGSPAVEIHKTGSGSVEPER